MCSAVKTGMTQVVCELKRNVPAGCSPKHVIVHLSGVRERFFEAQFPSPSVSSWPVIPDVVINSWFLLIASWSMLISSWLLLIVSRLLLIITLFPSAGYWKHNFLLSSFVGYWCWVVVIINKQCNLNHMYCMYLTNYIIILPYLLVSYSREAETRHQHYVCL